MSHIAILRLGDYKDENSQHGVGSYNDKKINNPNVNWINENYLEGGVLKNNETPNDRAIGEKS